MSSRTHGDWFGRDEDDTPTDVHPVVQRPISVAALLKREGHDGPSQEGMTRRTLTGVAAGAVMVFSAAVGSLLLHHGDTPTGAVAGSGNGDVLAADGAIAGTTTPAANQQSLPTSTYTTTTPAAATPKVNTNIAPKTVTHSRTTTNAPATTQAPVATTSQAPATSSAPATTANPGKGGSSASSAPSSTAGNSSSASPSTGSSSTTTPSNGGLLGTVTGTVTGVLNGVNNVASSTFNWFGN